MLKKITSYNIEYVNFLKNVHAFPKVTCTIFNVSITPAGSLNNVSLKIEGELTANGRYSIGGHSPGTHHAKSWHTSCNSSKIYYFPWDKNVLFVQCDCPPYLYV
jgi:hypothetical protein